MLQYSQGKKAFLSRLLIFVRRVRIASFRILVSFLTAVIIRAGALVRLRSNPRDLRIRVNDLACHLSLLAACAGKQNRRTGFFFIGSLGRERRKSCWPCPSSSSDLCSFARFFSCFPETRRGAGVASAHTAALVLAFAQCFFRLLHLVKYWNIVR